MFSSNLATAITFHDMIFVFDTTLYLGQFEMDAERYFQNFC